MNGETRRKEIINILSGEDRAVPGNELASRLGVSRQVIVQDMALLKAGEVCVVSTAKGYKLDRRKGPDNVRIFKVQHTDSQTRDELNTIVDLGGTVVDVFVKHRVYGELRADLNIASRLDVELFLEEVRNGKSSLLKNVTAQYHYHTVEAKDSRRLDMIEQALQNKGYLAPLLDYEIN